MEITAIGSLPGTDFRGACQSMAEEFPAMFPWPELPSRPLSDMVSRGLALLPGLGAELVPSGWRLINHPSAEQRRAAAWWRSDFDDAEELLLGYQHTIKLAVIGPWTLAAWTQLPKGEAVLSDRGAVRDVGQSLLAGMGDLVADLAKRLPDATVAVQIDEPALSDVARGAIRTASTLRTLAPVGRRELEEQLAPFARLGETSILHCCADGDWLHVATTAGFSAAALDTRWLQDAPQLDAVGTWLGQGKTLLAGVADTSRATFSDVDAVVRETLRVARLLQVAPETFLDRVWLTPACGMASWTPSDVLRQASALRDAVPLIVERLG